MRRKLFAILVHMEMKFIMSIKNINLYAFCLMKINVKYVTKGVIDIKY